MCGCFCSLWLSSGMCVFSGQQRWAMSSCVVKSRSRNPYTAVRVDPDSDYITPGTLDLEQLFWTGTGAQYAHVNQVWPNIYIGDEWVNAHREHKCQNSWWQLHIESVCYMKTGKRLWSGLVWRIWVLHMSLTQQRESGIMCWLVLITTLTSSTLA